MLGFFPTTKTLEKSWEHRRLCQEFLPTKTKPEGRRVVLPLRRGGWCACGWHHHRSWQRKRDRGSARIYRGRWARGENGKMDSHPIIPSGKRLHNYGKSLVLMGKSTISTGPFSIAMLVYQRVPLFFSAFRLKVKARVNGRWNQYSGWQGWFWYCLLPVSDRFKSQLNSKLKSAKCCKSGDMEHADHVITILRSWYNSIYNMNMYMYIYIYTCNNDSSTNSMGIPGS